MKHLTLKELPISERPYEKCEKYGVSSLSNAELLAVIIKSGSQGMRAIEVANRVLNFRKETPGLTGLNYLSLEDLMTIRGIGRVKAIQLLCVTELTKRMAKERYTEQTDFSSPKLIAEYYMQDMRYLECEQVMLLLLDTKCHRIKDFMISKGTVNAAMAEPREVYRKALQYGAVTIVLLHNHPSGDVTPSKADETLTRRLVEVGKLVGIPLVDHIIIGNNAYMSFRENGMM